MLLGACTANYQDDNTNPYEATADDMAKDDYMLVRPSWPCRGCVIPTDAIHYQYVECLMGGSHSGYLADSGGMDGKILDVRPPAVLGAIHLQQHHSQCLHQPGKSPGSDRQ